MIFQNPASILLVSALILIQFLLLTNSQVFPEQYFFPRETDLVAVNGSSSKGRCSNFVYSNTRQTCLTPTSSVLFDGNVSTLTGLDGDMWASQLLTINTTYKSVNITFDFTTTPNYTGMGRVEVLMFNCPEWGISVTTIKLFSATSRSGNRNFVQSIPLTTTSCDSLVRVRISHTVSSFRSILTLVFYLFSTSNWMHLAKVTFYASGSAHPPNTIITPTTSPTPTTLPPKNTILSKNSTTIINNVLTTEITTTMTTDTTMGNVTEIAAPSSDPTIVIISVVVTTSFILIIVTIIVILILTKHKTNASTDTALGESYTTRQQYNPHSERGHASLCKKTGQVYYSTPEDGGEEADPSHQIYKRLTHDTHNTVPEHTSQGNYEMGEYSTLSNCRQSHGGRGEEVRTTVMKNEDKQEESSSSAIYAQVDKKKSKKEKSPPQTIQPYTQLDQMYAQVDKKKREVSEDPSCESGDVYSVVNKPSAPEIPQKSELLLKELTITQLQ